jgi:hypothetical protein
MSRASQRRASNSANRAISLAAQLGYGPGSLPVVHTHYIPAFAPVHPSASELQRSVCGQYVNPAERHALVPTCPNCRAAIAREVSA